MVIVDETETVGIKVFYRTDFHLVFIGFGIAFSVVTG
jgi:hypothetical protein